MEEQCRFVQKTFRRPNVFQHHAPGHPPEPVLLVLKDVRSAERLLDETALFLHRVVAGLPPERQQMLERLHGSNQVLRGRKILVVDDDARNIFALTSLLENHEMNMVSSAGSRANVTATRRPTEPTATAS